MREGERDRERERERETEGERERERREEREMEYRGGLNILPSYSFFRNTYSEGLRVFTLRSRALLWIAHGLPSCNCAQGRAFCATRSARKHPGAILPAPAAGVALREFVGAAPSFFG